MGQKVTLSIKATQSDRRRKNYHSGGSRLELEEERKSALSREVNPRYLGRNSLGLSAIRTNSISAPACIFRITLPRWIFIVASLAPISEAVFFFRLANHTSPTA